MLDWRLECMPYTGSVFFFFFFCLFVCFVCVLIITNDLKLNTKYLNCFRFYVLTNKFTHKQKYVLLLIVRYMRSFGSVYSKQEVMSLIKLLCIHTTLSKKKNDIGFNHSCWYNFHPRPPLYWGFCLTDVVLKSGPKVIKNFMLNSAEHEIFQLINVKCQQLLAFNIYEQEK